MADSSSEIGATFAPTRQRSGTKDISGLCRSARPQRICEIRKLVIRAMRVLGRVRNAPYGPYLSYLYLAPAEVVNQIPC